MAKYTIEVRTILENLLGMDEHGEFSDVEDIVERSWNLVFDEEVYSRFVYYHYPTYGQIPNPETPPDEYYYGDMLCQYILREFFTREICCEAVGLWIHWMNERLLTNFDYLKQLYDAQIQSMFIWQSTLSKLRNKETIRFYGENDSWSKESTEITKAKSSSLTNNIGDTSDYDNTNANGNSHIYSDTPQGDFDLIDGVEPTPNTHLLYATEGEITTGGGTDTNDISLTGTRVDAKSRSADGTYDYSNIYEGDDGERWKRTNDFNGLTMQELRKVNAESFIDAEKEVNRIFGDLFLNLY